jgi:hypothetical protein
MANHSQSGREPLLSRAGIVTALHVLAALCVQLGAGNVSTWLGAHSGVIASVVLALAPLVVAFVSRGKVTPLSSPKSADGVDLVPKGSAAAVVDAAAVLARTDAIAADASSEVPAPTA